MPFGILGKYRHSHLYHINANNATEDHQLEHVPGTGLLSDRGIVHGNTITIDEASNLKRGTGRYAHVVLIPQPSDDPNDP